MNFIVFLMICVIGFMLIYFYKKISLAFDLIFNKLEIDTEIWGSDKDV